MQSLRELAKERTRTMRKLPRVFFSVVLVAAAIPMDVPVSEAQDRSQGRSMVISRGGIVAAESPLAAQAGARILVRGGNAVEAALGTHATTGCVVQMTNGVGGEDLACGRSRAKGGRSFSQWGFGLVARTGRDARQRGVLQRRNCHKDSGINQAAQRTDGRARLGGILQRICRTDFYYVSRL